MQYRNVIQKVIVPIEAILAYLIKIYSCKALNFFLISIIQNIQLDIHRNIYQVCR